MILVDIREEAALMIHDPDYAEISKAQWLMFFRSASWDARSAGWLLPLEDDETILIADNTWEYDVPRPFASIDMLLIEETVNGSAVYVNIIPRAHWTIRLNASAPAFTFSTLTYLASDKHIKVVGQQRPTIYTDENETIDPGMESFIRERALYFAFRFLGAGLSELARWRQQMSMQSWQTSERMLQNHPQEFRMSPSGLIVPGRG